MPWLLVFGRELEPGACFSFPVFGGLVFSTEGGTSSFPVSGNPAFVAPGGDEGDASSPFPISLSRASEADWPIFRVQEVIFGLPLLGVADVLEGFLHWVE